MNTNLVSHTVLFSRRNNENASTPMDPVGPFIEGAVDLEATDSFCMSFDNDMLVKEKVYGVREIKLPEFLSVEEWVSNETSWKWAWGCGVDPTWPEAWQRGIVSLRGAAEKLAVVKLLKTKKFRSTFRESLRDQLVAWFETPVGERRYATPLSARQWDCAIDQHTAREAHRLDQQLYNNRRAMGAAA